MFEYDQKILEKIEVEVCSSCHNKFQERCPGPHLDHGNLTCKKARKQYQQIERARQQQATGSNNMHNRNKLSLMICEATQQTLHKCDFNCEKRGECAYCLTMADHLLANGVVFQACTPIEVLDLNSRTYNTLKRIGVNTIEELQELDEGYLLRQRWMGKITVEKIKQKINEMNRDAGDSNCHPAPRG